MQRRGAGPGRPYCPGRPRHQAGSWSAAAVRGAWPPRSPPATTEEPGSSATQGDARGGGGAGTRPFAPFRGSDLHEPQRVGPTPRCAPARRTPEGRAGDPRARQCISMKPALSPAHRRRRIRDAGGRGRRQGPAGTSPAVTVGTAGAHPGPTRSSGTRRGTWGPTPCCHLPRAALGKSFHFSQHRPLGEL